MLAGWVTSGNNKDILLVPSVLTRGTEERDGHPAEDPWAVASPQTWLGRHLWSRLLEQKHRAHEWWLPSRTEPDACCANTFGHTQDKAGGRSLPGQLCHVSEASWPSLLFTFLEKGGIGLCTDPKGTGRTDPRTQ